MGDVTPGRTHRPRTVDQVIQRLRAIDDELPRADGVAVFNRMYLTVTTRVADVLASGDGPIRFHDPEMVADLDVRFAKLWLEPYETNAAGKRVSPAWRPLFQARNAGLLPIQYALAGLNAHIEHDLPLAVVATCRARGLEPEEIESDYERVNDVLAQVEAQIRRSFLDELQRGLDDRAGPVAHLVSSWSIDKARDLSWITAQTLWALRSMSLLRGRFLDGLAHTVGMTSRVLLTPCIP